LSGRTCSVAARHGVLHGARSSSKCKRDRGTRGRALCRAWRVWKLACAGYTLATATIIVGRTRIATCSHCVRAAARSQRRKQHSSRATSRVAHPRDRGRLASRPSGACSGRNRGVSPSCGRAPASRRGRRTMSRAEAGTTTTEIRLRAAARPQGGLLTNTPGNLDRCRSQRRVASGPVGSLPALPLASNGATHP